MDIRICLLLAAEAGLALVLLWSAGVLRKPAHVLCAVLLLAAAFVLSPYGLPMLGAWLVAQLHLLRDWMKEKVYW